MLRPIAPFVEYVINKDYIAAFLCINQDKPELECEGKCHLYREVGRQQEEEKKALKISLEEYPIGFVKIQQLQKKKRIRFLASNLFTRQQNYSFLYVNSIFIILRCNESIRIKKHKS